MGNIGYNDELGTGFQRQVTFSEAIQSAFNKYCCFSGRASRSEFWWFYLFSTIVGWIAGLIDMAIGTELIAIIAGAVIFLPGLGLTWRRLHDIGKGGGWFFICFIPLVGAIILLIWYCKDSEMFTNRFGPIPNWEE